MGLLGHCRAPRPLSKCFLSQPVCSVYLLGIEEGKGQGVRRGLEILRGDKPEEEEFVDLREEGCGADTAGVSKPPHSLPPKQPEIGGIWEVFGRRGWGEPNGRTSWKGPEEVGVGRGLRDAGGREGRVAVAFWSMRP